MISWTDEQLAAIDAYNHPTIVSAAAGSGKTAVLVERAIRLLADSEKNIPADSLLAVTFTNDAAAQMREKLSNAFEKLLAEHPDDPWILSQYSLLRLADITTINAFCYGVVKDNLEKTPFSTGVRIMEENEADMLVDRALTEVLEQRYSSEPEKMEWLISIFCKENDAKLRVIVKQLYDFLRTLPYRELWIDKQLLALRNGTQSSAAMAGMIELAKKDAATLMMNTARLRSLCEGLEYHPKDRLVMETACDLAESLCNTVCSADWDGCVTALHSYKYPSRAGCRQTAKEKELCSELEYALFDSAKDLFESIKKALADLSDYCKYPTDAIKSDALLVADAFEALCDICDSLDKQVMSEKISKNALDFADTELITVKLLTQIDENSQIVRTPLCEEIVSSKRYRLIIIDEFQDVNDLQNVIFKSISETDDLDVIGSNVFVVGDAKQAIYRFRRSNPMIFTNTRLAAKKEGASVKEALLTYNFRSRENVLEFCNYIFSALMSTSVGEIDYNQSESLRRGADYKGDDPATELIFIDSDAGKEDGSEEFYPDEFQAVAAKIRKLLDEGALVKDGDGYRPCVPGDFCVLTRNNIKDTSLLDSFEEVGLKIVTVDHSGYLGSREIALLINLLKCIATPMRDVPMASVMLSPILGFTDDDLALVKLVSMNSRLYANMLKITMGEADVSKELFAKCEYAVSLFKKLRVYSAEYSLTTLIKKVYDETDIFSVTSVYDDSARRLANLRLLLEYAQSYEDSSTDGVAGFLRYIDHISKSGGDFKQAYTVTESDNAVSTKTIHKSKGLEYPFVFLCQTGKSFNSIDLQGALHLNSDGGVGINFLDQSTLTKHKTIFAEHIRNINESEMISEELRLLYVALTRAKERLFIVLNKNEKTLTRVRKFAYAITDKKVPVNVAGKAKTFSDWIYMAMLGHPVLKEALSDRLPEDAFTSLPDVSHPNVVTSNALTVIPHSKDGTRELTAAPDSYLSRRLKEAFAYEYDNRLVENEAKLTVTEIIKEEYLDFFANMPQIGEEFGKLTPAQKGTLTHKFMQLCRFETACDDLEAEISRLTNAGQFTQKQAAAIDRGAVKGFFDSDIFARMLKSENVMREKQFLVRFDDIDIPEKLAIMYKGTQGMLQGIADCVFEEKDGYVLVDYKTDRVKSEQELLDRYADQLVLYKAAFGAVLDKPVKSAYIYSFRLARGIEVPL